MNKTIGFIGCGNMGSAMLSGILSANLIDANKISVSTLSEISKNRMNEKFHVYTTLNNLEVARRSDIIILAIKPNKYEEVIKDIKEVAKDKIIVSIAAGISMKFIKECFAYDKVKIVRTMPNTPACVQAAMSSLCVNEFVTAHEKQSILEIFSSFGRVEEIEESLIDAIISTSGSSPAYIFMVINAMIKNGVKHGLSEKQARTLVCQSVLGSAIMVLNSEEDPNILKQNVCSKGGTTIEAVKSLENDELEKIIDKAMDACFDRSVALNK